jgi:hypothetical protein
VSTGEQLEAADGSPGKSKWFALLYPIKPGSRDAVAALFAGSGRPDHDVRDDDGNVVGRLLTTIVFVGREACVRVIEVEGDIRTVARHMSRQAEIRDFEREIESHLMVPRDMSSPGGAQAFFQTAGMECVLYRRHDA